MGSTVAILSTSPEPHLRSEQMTAHYRMIAERFPEVMALSDEDKFRFIAELWEDVAGEDVAEDPGIAALLEQRLADYHANPQNVSSWEEVKARILASRRG
jgi:putative addiction module component (TIGR02574 family)